MTSVRMYSTNRQTPAHTSAELHENKRLDGKNCKVEKLICQDQRHIEANMIKERKTLPRLQVSKCSRIEIPLPSENPFLRRLPKFTKEDKV